MAKQIPNTHKPESQKDGDEVKQLNQGDARRVYTAPCLIAYGDVRDVTMGPTVGFGESGGGPFCAEGVNCP